MNFMPKISFIFYLIPFPMRFLESRAIIQKAIMKAQIPEKRNYNFYLWYPSKKTLETLLVFKVSLLHLQNTKKLYKYPKFPKQKNKEQLY